MASPIDEDSRFIVWSDGTTVSRAGGTVLDNYGSFVQALLSPSEVERLENQGITVEVAPSGARRGGFSTTDPIPIELRAPLTTTRYIVEFRGPMREEWETGLREVGARIIEYIPRNAFLVDASPTVFAAISVMEGVDRIVPYHAAFKLDVRLLNGGPHRILIVGDPTADRQALKESIVAKGATVRKSFTSDRHLFDATASVTAIFDIAKIESVLWIEPRSDGTEGMDKASSVTQSGTWGNFSLHNQTLSGETQGIIVCERGLETIVRADYLTEFPGSSSLRPVISLRNGAFDDNTTYNLVEYNAYTTSSPLSLDPHRKVSMYYSAREDIDGVTVNYGDHLISGVGPSPHGTQVAGVALSDRAPYSSREAALFDGVAYGSHLFFCDTQAGNSDWYEMPMDRWNYLKPAYENNDTARTASFSIRQINGSETYTEVARQFDNATWHHRDLTVVYMLGNVAHVNGTAEAMAKNIITVGGLTSKQPCTGPPPQNPTCAQYGDDVETVSTGSQQGPAADGRIKPNVVAPGFCVVSQLPFNLTDCVGGTSFATPLVAGGAALVREYFERGYYPNGTATTSDSREPSSALVRAVVMMSGREIANNVVPTYPSGEQGWGRVTLDDALYFANISGDRKLIVADEGETANLTGGYSWSKTFHANASTPFRVMLSWTDYPGTAGANASFNDLDLTVSGLGCKTLGVGQCVGNSFVGATGYSAVGTNLVHDHIDSNEGVFCAASGTAYCTAQTGNYTITVHAFTIVSSYTPQPFAVAVTGDVYWT